MKNEETNTEQAILKAAEELFLEQGFEQTTTKQIAQRAGCNQALLHYYYRTKDNLFVQIFEEKAKFIATHFLDINSTAQTLEERISQMVELHFELFRKNPRLVPFLLKEVLSDPVRVAPILDKIKQYMVKIFGKIDEALHEEIEKGAARPVSTLNVILTLVSLDMAPFIIAPVLQRVLDLTDEQLDEQLDKRKPEVVEILLRQIRKSPFEPVCRMVIIVDAGAVAEANAARTIEKARFKCNIQKESMNTNTEAASASASVITTTFPMLFFSFENLKNSPVLNAIKARAISARNSVPLMMFCGTRSRQKGPIKIPTTAICSGVLVKKRAAAGGMINNAETKSIPVVFNDKATNKAVISINRTDCARKEIPSLCAISELTERKTCFFQFGSNKAKQIKAHIAVKQRSLFVTDKTSPNK